MAERHKLENPDDFRRSVLDNEAIFKELQQWTGHKSIRSINTYIGAAFNESPLPDTVGIISKIQTLETIALRLEEAERSLEKIGPREVLRHVRDALQAGLKDLKKS